MQRFQVRKRARAFLDHRIDTRPRAMAANDCAQCPDAAVDAVLH
jgi:hypothetical protein